MIKRETWLYNQHPERHIPPYHGRPQHHAVAKTADELSKENKKVFRNIAKEIYKVFPDVKVYAFGSRVKGRWGDNSDYDVNIEGLSKEMRATVKSLFENSDVRIDIKFNHPLKIKVLL